MYKHVSIFPLGGFDPRVVRNKIINYPDPVSMIIREILQGCLQPDIQQKRGSEHKSRQLNDKSKAYLGTSTSSHGLLIDKQSGTK
jgi:hypothetical protein